MFQRIKRYLPSKIATAVEDTQVEHRTDRRDDRKEQADNRAFDQDQYMKDRKDDAEVRAYLRNRLRRRQIAQLMAYVLFVCLGLFVAYDNERDNKARCEAGASSREAQRDTINEVANLALELTTPPQGVPAERLSPEGKVERVTYTNRVERFRAKTIRKIVPNQACAKYGLEN